MAILFCHGLESGPVGRKSLALEAAGWEVIAPDCRGQDLQARVRTLEEMLVEAGADTPPMVIGSSFGGIAGLLAVIGAAKRGVVVPALVLLAPALQLAQGIDRPGSLAPPAPTVILHGRLDAVISIEVSREYSRAFDVPLLEVDDDHRLGASSPQILEVVAELASRAGRASSQR